MNPVVAEVDVGEAGGFETAALGRAADDAAASSAFRFKSWSRSDASSTRCGGAC